MHSSPLVNKSTRVKATDFTEIDQVISTNKPSRPSSNDLLKSSPLSNHISSSNSQQNNQIRSDSRTSSKLRKNSISEHRMATAMLALEELSSNSSNEFSSPQLHIKNNGDNKQHIKNQSNNKENHHDHHDFLTSAGNFKFYVYLFNFIYSE